MKKIIILILSVMALSLILSGCGGGGGGGDDTGSLTVTFHFKWLADNSGISGVTVGYTTPPPASTELTSPATDSNGDFTLVLKTAGTYTVKSVTYQGHNYPFDDPMEVPVSQESINKNEKAEHTIIIDPTGDDGKPSIHSIDGELQD
jgi:predicted small secreted protein